MRFGLYNPNMDKSEATCKYVGSRGIMKSCDVFSKQPHSSIRIVHGYGDDIVTMDDGNTLYICNAAIREFRKMLYMIPSNFILVSGDCDVCCWQDMFDTKNEFLMFIENPKIIHWFAQNCICLDHPKLSQIPIGLDYHTMSERVISWGPMATPVDQEVELESIVQTAKPFYERTNQICAYSNFHFAMNTRFAFDRRNAIDEIPASSVYYEPNQITRRETWTKQLNYAFVVSPHGGGLDCHRTWEALVLGCIPIVKTSPLDPLFDGLPVWIVQKWSDVTAENMKKIVAKFRGKTFQLEKLRLDYWMAKIRTRVK